MTPGPSRNPWIELEVEAAEAEVEAAEVEAAWATGWLCSLVLDGTMRLLSSVLGGSAVERKDREVFKTLTI